MYAIIETGGKQYRVQEGDILEVEKLNCEAGSVYSFDKVLAVAKDDGTVDFGKPYLKDVKVDAKVLEHGKGEKIIVFKYKPKKNERKKRGHRQPFTRVQIEKIV